MTLVVDSLEVQFEAADEAEERAIRQAIVAAIFAVRGVRLAEVLDD